MDGGGLGVALMGPMEARLGCTPVRLTTSRLRTLLAALAVSAGHTVSVDRLALALWGERHPANVRRSVQTYVTRLRGVVGRAAIRTMPDGYRLDVDPDQVDVLRFRRLLAEAARSRGTAAEPALVEEASLLWRGTPFEDIDSDWLRAHLAPPLQELYLSAVERRIDLRLAEGRPGGLVAELLDLAARHPLREPLWARLLLVLGRCGRQAEALAQYERLRLRLADELGTDPGQELRRIHAALLHDDRPPPSMRAASGATDQAGVLVLSRTDGAGSTFLALVWSPTA
ncbi:AfsR/SARP family transcriptional regulator [Nonomuraea sp. NBC_01738]|uniref:AfsR/SARP family transcriptional regulator n=1 Tax=Nonomuraea sp. NBC_01738 TaxID=2976003 RepID=UPI002E10D465|nr:AfsR/SARP family transcriptional regulator [Nonomuraea sp. NBC_01738]